MSKNIIACLHIEKTAGSTFREILKVVYKSGFVGLTHTHTIESAWNLARRVDFSDMDIIYGHMPYGIHKFFPEDISCSYFTILRNPVERLLSLWHFDRINRENRLSYDKGSPEEFMEWANDQRVANRDNEMTRVISGNNHSFVSNNDTFITEKDYRAALSNLMGFSFVGTVENFDLDLVRLSKMLNWRRIPKQEKIYSFPERLTSGDLPTMDRKKIEGSQYYDLCLWEEAKKFGGTILSKINV